MSVISGTIILSVDLKDTLAIGATRLSATSIPCRPADHSVTYGDGTAANSAQGIYQKSASLVATTIDIDMASTVQSNGTVGFTRWRELMISNDSTTDTLTVGLGAPPFSLAFLGGRTPKILMPPGRCFRQAKPLGSVGYVTASQTIIRLNSGSATIAYRMVILGD